MTGGPVVGAGERRQLADALAELGAILSEHVDNLQEESEAIAFDQGRLRVEVCARPLGLDLADGSRLIGTLEARTDLTAVTAQIRANGSTFPSWPVVASANMHTLVSATVWPPAQSDRLELITRMGLYKDDVVSLTWGPYLVALGALTQLDIFSFSYARLSGTQFDSCRTTDALRIELVPNGWPGDHFALAARQLRQWNYQAAGGEKGLAIAFPWSGPIGGLQGSDPEPPRTPEAAYTAEVVPHPLLGPGILTRLELPVAFDLKDGAQVANELNAYEVEVLDGPPLVGGWAANTTTGRLTFATFFPYRVYHFDLLVFPGVWAGIRTRHAEAWLSTRRNLH